jgi:hypothetical protein
LSRVAFLLVAFGMITGGLTLTAYADDNQTVSATVTPLLISVNVAPGSVNYGTQPFSAVEVAPNPTSVVVTNSGSVTETFQIRGAASTPSGWTLGGTAGSNTYVHRFKLGQGTFAPLTTSNQLLVSNVPTTSNVDVFLNLDMPTSSTFLTQQTLPVTIVATQ